jgi:hypothetical protein
MSRITLLVGAGLVYDAELPMSVQLATKLKEKLKEGCNSNADKEETDLAKLQLAIVRFLNGGIRFKEGILNRDPDEPVNIEQIAIAALELQERLENPLAPYASGWHQRIVELEEQNKDILQKFIDFIYSQLDTWLTFKTDEAIAYLARLSDFSDTSLGDGVDIFSLNYDLCIETAISQTYKKDFINGFSEDGWQADLLSKSHPIRLLKLHGSLDWFDDDGAFGICSTKFPKHKEAESLSADLRPLLIFGTNHKLSARQPFLTLAYHFSRSVLNTPVLGIIGYSFGDSHINQMIEQGFRTNSKLDLLRDNPRVSVIKKGAKDALNNNSLLNEVRKLLKESQDEEPF